MVRTWTVAGVLVVFLLGCSSQNDRAEPASSTALERAREVVHLKNTASSDSEAFVVAGRWRINANVGGDGVSYMVMDAATDEPITVDSLDGGEAEVLRHGRCRCYLSVSSYDSPYEIWVTDLPD